MYHAGRNDEAVRALKQGLSAAQPRKDFVFHGAKVDMWRAYYYLGRISWSQKKFSEALLHFDDADRILTSEHRERVEVQIKAGGYKITGNHFLNRFDVAIYKASKLYSAKAWEKYEWDKYSMAPGAKVSYRNALLHGSKEAGELLNDLRDREMKKCEKWAKQYAQSGSDDSFPEEVRGHLIKAQSLRKGKQYRKAEVESMKALESMPHLPMAHYNLALIAGAQKNYNNAIDHMKCFLKIAPNHTKARKGKDKLYEWEASAE
ncbi:tetratricopeptide repeat protein [Elusimicrobiota bacterium]